MDSTFYKEEGPKFLAEQEARLQALGMSFHSRLGSMSPLGQIPEELLEHQLAPYITKGGDLFPQIHLVDRYYDTGLFAEGFDPGNAQEIDASLVLRITVSFQGREETLFSGKVLPRAYHGTLSIRTHRSEKGYHHSFIINQRVQGKFSLETVFHGMQENMYGFQVQDITDQNWSIRQDTPQGISVEISRVIHTPLPSALPWPGLREPEIFYTPNPKEISAHNQNFKFMILVSNHVIFQGPVVNPHSHRNTIKCSMEHEGFSIKAGVEFNNLAQDRNSFELLAAHYQLNDSSAVGHNLNIGRQRLYLDDPEPLQHMHQDLLGGYISFRVERLADGWADS